MSTITCISFAYEQGLPQYSERDRVYIVDCRTIRDPMWESFSGVTGRDQVLVDHFEKQVEMKRFLEKTLEFLFYIQDKALLQNNPRNTVVAFGCTHGRHRSVYCADFFTRDFFDKYQLPITCIHREQNIDYALGN